jgi:molybdopterin converting factor small subunit
MEINVFFLGILAEVAHTSFKHYSNVGSLDDLRLRIEDDIPGMVQYEYRILINSETPPGNLLLADGDEVTLVPPLTGERNTVK